MESAKGLIVIRIYPALLRAALPNKITLVTLAPLKKKLGQTLLLSLCSFIFIQSLKNRESFADISTIAATSSDLLRTTKGGGAVAEMPKALLRREQDETVIQ